MIMRIDFFILFSIINVLEEMNHKRGVSEGKFTSVLTEEIIWDISWYNPMLTHQSYWSLITFTMITQHQQTHCTINHV